MSISRIYETINNLQYIKSEERLGVAVSGGVDSMTLLHVSAAWAKKFSKKLYILSFNHNLRRNSFEDVKLVKKVCCDLRLKHKYFTWNEKPSTGILNKARNARYKIFSEYCKYKNISTLLIAHTADDIAETLAIRILNNSNLDGLCTITERRRIFDINIVRPFLKIKKSHIYNFAKRNKITYAEDPSNNDNKYLRSRIRKYLKSYPELSDFLVRASFGFCNLRQINYNIIKNKFKFYYEIKKEGYIIINRKIFTDFPNFLTIRFLTKCIMQIGNRKYPPRSKKLKIIFANLKRTSLGNFSLAGCILSSRKDNILVMREFEKICSCKKEIKKQDSFIWDNRFVIYNKYVTNLYSIFPLGKIIRDDKTKYILKKTSKLNNKIPFHAKKALPVIKTLEGLLLIPHLNIYETYGDKLRVDVHDFYNENNNYNF